MSANPPKPEVHSSETNSGALSARGYNEKRDFIRMQINSPVEFWLASEDTRHAGVCHDLSGGGMMVRTATKLTEGCELEVLLASSHGHAPMLRATATVTRVDCVGQAYLVGLRLKDILV